MAQQSRHFKEVQACKVFVVLLLLLPGKKPQEFIFKVNFCFAFSSPDCIKFNKTRLIGYSAASDTKKQLKLGRLLPLSKDVIALKQKSRGLDSFKVKLVAIIGSQGFPIRRKVLFQETPYRSTCILKREWLSYTPKTKRNIKSYTAETYPRLAHSVSAE